MRNLRILTFLGLCLMVAPYAHAQRFGVAIGVGPGYVGPPPVCPYGYFNYYPYACAPYGYYGPAWFSGGVFIGAGPWFHGYRGYYSGGGYFGRGPAFSGPGGYRGGFGHGYSGGRFNGGGSFHGGGGNFHGGGGGGSHGGGRR
ncbi:MAG: hypothetical protein ABSF45_00965 [Terriglobia bacterium]|jgi:hypothetical protein